MIGYIYCYRNTINNKVYIGQTDNINRRKKEHISKANRGYKEKFYNAIRKYGIDNFEFSILYSFNSSSSSRLSILLDAMEVFLIKKYNSFYEGYNSTLGGHSKRGYTFSEEFKAKCRNKVFSNKTREKMSSSAKNKIVSKETRDKHRDNALKRNFSKYRELNIDKLNINRRLSRIKTVLQLSPEGTIINEWESLVDAVNYLHSLYPNVTLYGLQNGISRHCKGVTKKNLYYGFIWKYKTLCLI